MFLTDPSCRLCREGIVSEEITWESGLLQSSPLSTILFVLYSSPPPQYVRDLAVNHLWVD